MIAVFLSPLYLLLNAYLVFRMLQWFRTLNGFLGTLWFVVPFLTFYILLCLTPVTAVLFHGRAQLLTKRISNYWLGILMYFLILLFSADLIWLIYCLLMEQAPFQTQSPGMIRIGGGIVFFCVLTISVCGICNAARIKKTFYEVTVDKPSDLSQLRIALIADLHLGCNVDNYLVKKMVKTVNVIRPNLIVFAGDIFDNNFDSIEHPENILRSLRELKSTYGAWACWGNHDISEKILAGFTFSSGDSSIGSDPRMNQFLKDAGIRLLEDESVQFGHSFTLTGRLDRSWPEKSGLTRKTPGQLAKHIDRKLPAIVIDHQPAEFDQLAASGFDLDLSGHTHNGQIFPSTIFTRIGWKNSYGVHKAGSFTSIVTSGAGVWGPAMRLGTHNEVVEILVNFQNAKP